MRVLVVEDDQDVGEMFADYLRELGHDPALVPSGEAAVERLQRERPDAILLDINLPGMSGLDFLQMCAPHEPEIPIVVVSGVATEHQAREALRLGAFDFLGKPVTLHRLAEVLDAVEACALSRGAAAQSGRIDRRTSRRVPVAIPVRVAERNGREWSATSVDLSPFGLKLDARIPMPPESVVRLAFTLPDGGPPLELPALIVRSEPGGQAFFFVTPREDIFQRLHACLGRSQDR